MIDPELEELSTADLLLIQDLLQFVAQFTHKGMQMTDSRRVTLGELAARIGRIIIARVAAGDPERIGPTVADPVPVARKPAGRVMGDEYRHQIRNEYKKGRQ